MPFKLTPAPTAAATAFAPLPEHWSDTNALGIARFNELKEIFIYKNPVIFITATPTKATIITTVKLTLLIGNERAEIGFGGGVIMCSLEESNKSTVIICLAMHLKGQRNPQAFFVSNYCVHMYVKRKEGAFR